MLIVTPENKFSRSYVSARKRFLAVSAKVGADLSQLPVQKDTSGEELVTDIAWCGAKNPRKALVVVSGVHGVEGFAGSAVQLAALENLPELPQDTALVLVHILNPYGMHNLRRANGNNVDLNRNFYFSAEDYQTENPAYAALDPLLNPQKKPSLDFFALKLLLKQLSIGKSALTQTVAGGQHSFAQGLFYGGQGLEIEAADYMDWLKQSPLSQVETLMFVDLHTGLGGSGEQSVFLRSDAVPSTELSQALKVPVSPVAKAMMYAHGGGCSGLYRHLFAAVEPICLTVEYGTCSGGEVLQALRAENQHHHYGDKSLQHWSKRKLKEAFCPTPDIWRRQVVLQGVELINRSMTCLSSGSPSARK